MNTKDGHVIVLCSESDENPDKLPRVRRFT